MMNEQKDVERLSPGMINALKHLCMGRPNLFWQKYLASKMSSYVFRVIYEGRPAESELVGHVIDAVDVAIIDAVKAFVVVSDVEQIIRNEVSQ